MGRTHARTLRAFGDIDIGIILEVGQDSGKRGRPTLLYGIDPGHGHALGVVLERGHVAVRTLDYRGGVVAEYQIDADEDNLPAAIADANELVKKCTEGRRQPPHGDRGLCRRTY